VASDVTERRTVLLIDNDRDVAEIVRAVLTDEGYEVAVMSDLAPDAVAAAVGRLEPDAVLLDGESSRARYGTSWDEAINLAQRERAVPVIMFSADAEAVKEATEGTSDRTVAAKLAGVIRKPFELDDLLREVAKAVGRSEPFDRSVVADEARTGALAEALAKIGATDVRPSARREWVTFRSGKGRLMQIYWWQTGGSYLVGRYDEDGRRLENLALTYNRPAALEICRSLLRAEEVDADA
jgi:CheY-like chemotaxis protein